MRIHIIGNEVKRIEDVRNYSGLWSYSIAKALHRKGVDVRFADNVSNALDDVPVDHIFALKWRYTENFGPTLLSMWKKRISGALVQFYDTPQTKRLEVDCAFTVRGDDVPANRQSQNHQIGWAADPELLYPDQGHELQILVDHALYGDIHNRPKYEDKTLEIRDSLGRWILKGDWLDKFERVKVREFTEGGFRDVGNLGKVDDYHKSRIPYLTCCEEYRRTHLFLVTHTESVGQTALEVAMAGGLPVVPYKFMPFSLLQTIDFEEWTDAIDWDGCVDAIDIHRSSRKAAHNTWDKVAGRMVDWFERFKR